MNRAAAPHLAGLLVLLLTAALTAQGLTAPFDNGDQGWSGAYYSLTARNLLRYPPTTLLGAMCIEPGALVDAPAIYANHPPAIAWLLAASFALFGEGALAARLGPWLLSIAAAGFAYGLMLRILHRHRDAALWSALAALLAVSTPAWVYYGSLPDPQGAGVLCAILAACWAAAGWHRHRRPLDAALCGAALLIGFTFDWPVYFAAGALALWALPQTGGRRLAAGIAGLTTAAAALTAGWTVAVYARRGGGPHILEGLANRTGLKGLFGGALADDAGNALSVLDLGLGIARHHLDAGFAPASLAGAASLVLLWRRGRRGVAGLLLVPFAAGGLHVLVFPQGAYVHQYWQLYLVAGLALPIVWAACEVTPARLRSAMIAGLLTFNVASGARAWLRAEVRWGWTAEERAVFQDVGEALRAATTPSTRLVSGEPGHVALDYYGDRKIAWESESLGADGLLSSPMGAGALEVAAAERWGEPRSLPHGWRLWLAEP